MFASCPAVLARCRNHQCLGAKSLLVGRMRVKPFLHPANLSWDLALWKRGHPFCYCNASPPGDNWNYYGQPKGDASSYGAFSSDRTNDRGCACVGATARVPEARPGPLESADNGKEGQ